MFGRIAVRNIPNDVWSKLEELAKQHERSTEAEARYALKSWVAPSIQDDDRSIRRTEVSSRLRGILDHVNLAIRRSAIKPSHIAQDIGESHCEEVENWFSGRSEPSFKQLEATALYLGGVSAWLQHGDGQMFPVARIRLAENATKACRWLLDADEPEKPSKIMFVRENTVEGSLAIVKQYGEWRCKTYLTGLHISEEIGAGGEAALAYFFVSLQLLYAHRNEFKPSISSYLMPSENFKALYNGNAHPLTVMRDASNRLWWEDLWDREMTHEYWTGWNSLCHRIHNVIDHKPRLNEERLLIHSRTHPFLNDSIGIEMA